jgi:hypothetical protein
MSLDVSLRVTRLGVIRNEIAGLEFVFLEKNVSAPDGTRATRASLGADLSPRRHLLVRNANPLKRRRSRLLLAVW